MDLKMGLGVQAGLFKESDQRNSSLLVDSSECVVKFYPLEQFNNKNKEILKYEFRTYILDSLGQYI